MTTGPAPSDARRRLRVRLVLAAIVLVALVAGGAMYWLQVHAFYRTLSPAEVGNVQVIDAESGDDLPLTFENLQAIDSDSSPIRFRACLRLTGDLAVLDRARPVPGAEPLVAPGWFDCFDAAAIGAALATGEARAFLWHSDVIWGVDRILAVYPDGRAYGWHQINACGAVVFDGDPVPEGCPPPPER